MGGTILKALPAILFLPTLAHAQVPDECLGTCSANAAVVCLADADCGAGDTCALPSPSCALPDPSNASWTASIVDALHDIDPTCPPPTVSQGSLCVLKKDVDLSSIGTMNVTSNTHLNCQGHRIYTSVPGTDANHRSKPEVGLHLAGAFGVKIQNCVIDGFDFPILAHDIKVPTGAMSDPGALEHLADKIIGNTVNGGFVSVELVKVDNMRIEGNTITSPWGSTIEVLVIRDSKINQIVNNTITRSGSGIVSVVRFPGPTSTSNPTTSDTISIYFSQGSTFPSLINMIVGGKLYQYPNPVPQFAPDGTLVNGGDYLSDNLVERNTVTSCVGRGCIGNSNALRTTVSGNQISNIISGNAITFGNTALSGNYPGTCTLNSNRSCLNNTDCNISTYDTSSQGTCAGVVPHTVTQFSNGGVIANNTITGPFNEGMDLETPNILIQGNTISGPMSPGTDFTSTGGVGIELRSKATPTAIVTQNIISNLPAPIRVFNGQAFGAQISLNDFTGYTDQAFVFSGYHFESELSVGLQGNYWGLPCSPTGGGGFDPSKVLVLSSGKVASDGTVSATGAVNLFAHDSHPYGVPVANTDPSLLPTTLSGGYCSASP
jgi:hypothetical protein